MDYRALLSNYTNTKQKLIDLSQKMNHIKINIENAVERMGIFKEEMSKSFEVNDKPLLESEIDTTKKNLDDIKKAIKYTLLPNIQSQINETQNKINETQNQINYIENERRRQAEEQRQREMQEQAQRISSN